MCTNGCGKAVTFSQYSESIPSRSLGTCEGITVDLLTMWINLFKCNRDHSLYSQVGINQVENDSAITLLTNWIAVKTNDPSSCDYMDQLAIVQSLVNKIIASGKRC